MAENSIGTGPAGARRVSRRTALRYATEESAYGSVLLILAVIAMLALVLYRISIRGLERHDARNAAALTAP